MALAGPGTTDGPGGDGAWVVDVSQRTRVTRGGVACPLRPKERAVLAAIAFTHPRSATVAEIEPLVWGDDIPPTAAKAIHNHVARLRQVAGGVIETSATGYRLSDRTQLVEATTHTAPQAYADLVATPTVVARRAALTRRTLDLQDASAEELLRRDEHELAVSRLTELAEAEPGRQRRWWLLMLAQAQLGRRDDALATYARAELLLARGDDEPGTELRRLRAQIADDDPVVFSADFEGHGSAAATVARSLTRGDAPTIELPRPMAVVTESMDHADEGPWIHVVGPAGAGKSTFVSMVAERAQGAGFAVFAAGNSPVPAEPLEPFAELLRQLGSAEPGRLRGNAGAQLATILRPDDTPASDVPASPHPERATLHAHVVEVLLAVSRPTMLIIEDLHFAPSATLELLALLVARRRHASAPLVVLTTSREDAPHETDHTLTLDPWATSTIEAYLNQFDVAPTWAREAAAWIRDQSSGNPLFVRELALVASSTPGAYAHTEHFVAPDFVPDAIRDAIRYRISLLSRSAAEAVEAAAVLGVEFRGSDLAAMVSDPLAGLAEARRVGILRPGKGWNVFEFRHELYHREILERLSTSRRVRLDDAAARVIAGDPSRLHDLARHARSAAAVDPARAIAATRAAAQVSARAYAHAEAAELYRSALSLVFDAEGRSAQWCDLAIDVGRCALAAGDAAGVDLMHEAAARADELDEPEIVGRAALEICRLGPTSVAGGVDDAAAALVERALSRVVDPATRARVAGAGTMVHGFSSDADRVRSLYVEAESNARLAGDPAVLADVLPLTYMSLGAPGDLDVRERNAAELVDIGLALDRADVEWEGLHLRLTNQIQRGAGDIRATMRRLDELAGIVNERSRDWQMLYNRSTLALIDGDLDAAEEYATRTFDYTDTIAESRVVAVYGAHVLAVRLAQDRVGELADVVRQIALDQPAIGAWKAALALASSVADPDESRRAFDEATADDRGYLAHDYTYTAALLCLGEAAVRLGDPVRAATAMALLDPLAGRWSWAGSVTFGPIDLTRARLAVLLGDHDAAVELCAATLDTCADLRAPLHAAATSRLLRDVLGSVTDRRT